jgi:hypothetical protein
MTPRAGFKPRRLDYFSVKPSVRGLEDWIVYEIRNPGHPLFLGPREAAEFEADRRNRIARERYRDTVLDGVFDSPKQDFLADILKDMEERCRKEETLGLANCVCINALSLPA